MALYASIVGRLLQREAVSLTRLPLSTSSTHLYDQKWRESKGLPQNPNKERILLDLPDYSFLDGRATPYGTRQKQRIEKQKLYSAKIIELTEEIDLAEKLYNEKISKRKMAAEERIKAKLRPKGEKTITS